MKKEQGSGKGVFKISVCIIGITVAVFYLGAIPVYAQSNLSKGLIGHWTFDDKDNPGRDSSGRDHHGVLKGPAWSQDEAGSGVLEFDGKDDYVDLSDIDEYEFGPEDGFTISMWVKPQKNRERHQQQGSKKAARAYIFGRTNDSRNLPKCTWAVSHIKALSFVMGNGDRSGASYPIGGSKYGPWHHLVVVVGAKDEAIDSYLNGVKTKSGKRTVGQLTQSTNSFRIGGEYQYYYFTGRIDDVRIYNRTLSQEEVLALNAQLKKPPTAQSQELFTALNTAVPVNVEANDPNNGDALTLKIVESPANGVLSGKAPSLIYTPKRDFAGKDSFTFKANDGKLDSAAATVEIDTSVPAFPGAEGFGAVATGGRGGRVIKVTNLKGSGPGSLQWACSQDGPKIIVFEVSGVITPANSRKGHNYLALRKDNITIAGQTAPGAGITIYGSIETTHPDRTGKERPKINNDSSRAGRDTNMENAIIRFLRIRSNGKCAFSASKAKQIMLDHASGSWGSDQCFNACNMQDITYQWCAVEETDPFLEGSEPHGFAMLNSYSPDGRLSLHHNLYIDHTGRSPCIDSTYRPDFVNNVLYNVGFVERYIRWLYVTDERPFAKYNIIGNYYKDGPGGMIGVRAHIPPDTSSQQGFVPSGSCKYFFDGNWFAWDGYAGKERYSGTRAKYLADKRWPTKPHEITIHTAEEACELQMAHVGCLPRDSVSARLVAEARTGTGSWGVHAPDAGLMEGLTPGKAPTDTDNDGMPDAWEKTHKLDPNDPSDNNKIVPAGASPGDRHKGYTWIEYYINELADIKIAEALTRARLDRTPPKPWDKPANKTSPRVAIHKSLDEMVKAVQEQNAERAKDKRKSRSLFSAWCAIQQLSRMGMEAAPAVPELAKGLAKGKNEPRAVTFAAWALGGIGPAAKAAVAELIKALKSEQGAEGGRTNFQPHGFIAWALGRIGMDTGQAAEAVPVLAGMLSGGDRRTWNNSAWTLSRLSKSAEPAMPALLGALGKDGFAGFFAARALANIGAPAVPGLVKALASRDSSANAARALGWMGAQGTEGIPALIEQLKKNSSGVVRGRVALALAEVDPAGATVAAALAGALSDSLLAVRVNAAQALGRCGSAAASAIPALEKALGDERREVKRAAALALGRTGKPALPALKKALVGEDPFVRKYAARALGNLGKDAAGTVDALTSALSDENAEVRREAIWSLALVAPEAKAAGTAVKKALSDGDYVVRYAAKKMLEGIEGK